MVYKILRKIVLFIFLLLLFVTDATFSLQLSTEDSLSSVIKVDTGLRTDSAKQAPAATLHSKSVTSDGLIHDTVYINKGPAKIPSFSEVVSYQKIYWSIFVLLMTYGFTRFIVSILDNFAEHSSNYRLFLKRLIPVLRLVLWILSIYFVVEGIIDPPVETLFAMLASIGLAVGFASQDLLKNFFGGFMIILDRPFQVGDKIQVGSDYGEVLQIGIRSTRIVTPDDSIITIPNGELMNRAVSNSNSGALDCQVVAELYVSAEADLVRVKRLAYLAAATSKYVFMQKPIVVATKSEVVLGKLFVKIRLKAYVLDIRYEFPFQSDMTERTLAAWKQQGIAGYVAERVTH